MKPAAARSLRRLAPVIVVWIVSLALAAASDCGSSTTESRRNCSANSDNPPFFNATDSEACHAAASRNGCQSHTFSQLSDACTGQQCTSCDR